MNIEELIAHLKNYPPHMRVIVKGYEGGYNDIMSLMEKHIALNVHSEDYYGAHDDAEDGKGIAALLLYGTNTNA